MGAQCSRRRRTFLHAGDNICTPANLFYSRHLAFQKAVDVSSTENDSVHLSKSWELVKYEGELPCERSGHSVVIHNRKAYMFGGYGGDPQAHLSDFFCLEFGRNKWGIIPNESDNVPCPRTAFAMCAAPNGSIYIWGGTDHDLLGLEDQQLYEYDTCRNQWNITSTMNTTNSLRYFGRSGSCYKNKLLFFGGGIKGGRFSNELISFDLEEKRWETVETKGSPPCPRYKHQCCVVEDRMFIIGGGCYLPPEKIVDTYVLCLQTMVWSRVPTTGSIPEGRAAHTCEYDKISNSIYLWGGFNHSLLPLPDMHRLNLTTLEWSVHAMTKKSVWPKRSFHASCLFEGKLFSFGGSDGEQRFGDVMNLQIHCNPLLLTDLAAQSCKTGDIKRNEQKIPEELCKKIIEPPTIPNTSAVPFS